MCIGRSGYPLEDGERGIAPIQFTANSVGFVEEPGKKETQVFLIGQECSFVLPNAEVKKFNPLRTGKGYGGKICNKCHVLLNHSRFDVNQTDSRGGKTSRPSCRKCRLDIDKRVLTAKQMRELNKSRPRKGTLWRCPICRKRSIVGVTAKVVLDHDKAEGRTRAFICDSCNTGLGRFKNGENILHNAIHYLSQHGGGPMMSKPKRGRPITRKIEIHATAEQIAKAIFNNAKPPDPTKRIIKKPRD